MKKIILPILSGLVFMTSCSNDETITEEKAPSNLRVAATSFIPLESTAIFVAPTLPVTEKEHALRLWLVNFSGEELNDSYIFDGIEIYDDGEGYDEEAGDGIYTSARLFTPAEGNNPDAINIMHIGSDFQFQDKLDQFLTDNQYVTFGKPKRKVSIEVKGGCKVRYTFSGNSSVFGIPCKYGGCVEFYDCKELEVEWSLGIEWEF